MRLIVLKNKLLLIIYYLIISRLPNTKFIKIFNIFRVWYVSKILKLMEFDKNSIFEDHVYISDGRNVKIGFSCHINERVFIQGATIGNYVMIAPNVSILNNSHKFDLIEIPMIISCIIIGISIESNL